MMIANLTRHIKNHPLITTALLLFLFFTGYYVLLLYRHTPSDIQAHAGIAYSYAVNGDKLFPNFLYFFLVALLSGFSKNMHIYYAVSVLLIAAAIAAKFFITSKSISLYCNINKSKWMQYMLPAFLMLFVFALPSVNFFTDEQYYYGLLPPNVWHNSTVIFLMPFALLLFFSSYRLFFLEQRLKTILLLQIFLLVIINALIKPSFLFTLVPAAFIVAIFNTLKKNDKTGVKALLPYIAGLLFVGLQYYLIFKQNQISGVVNSGNSSDVVVVPFEVWRYYSPDIPISFIASFFFPLVYIVVSKGRVLKNGMVQFALLNYFGAVAVWVLFAEDGFRKYDANFCWQAIIGAYILYLVLLIQLINDVKKSTLNKLQQYITGGSFLLHFLWGIVYWLKIIIFKSYL